MKTLSKVVLVNNKTPHKQDFNLFFEFGNEFESMRFMACSDNKEVANQLYILADNIGRGQSFKNINEPTEEIKYMIGQRVIYYNVICTICEPENNDSTWAYWVYNPERGYNHGVSPSNIKALPNGQL